MKSHVLNLLLLLAIGVVVFGAGIGGRDLWAPDEPRFGEATREMLQRGDPFVLHVNGEPYPDKPPMLMWMAAGMTLLDAEKRAEIAASRRASGPEGPPSFDISSFAVRAPSVFGGLMGLAATYALGCMMFGSRRAGFLAAAATATLQMYAWQGARAQLDMLMSGWSYVAVLAFWLARERGAVGWWALFWIAGGLATLSKGPPGLIVPVGTAAFCMMAERDAQRAAATAGAWAGAVLALTLLAKASFMQGAGLLILLGATVLALLVWTLRAWLGPAWRENRGRLAHSLGRFVLGVVLCAAVVGVWFVPYRLNAPREASSDTLVTQTVTRFFVGISHEEPFYYYALNLVHGLAPWTLFAVAAAIAMLGGPFRMRGASRRLIVCWILFTFVFFSLSPGKRDQYLLPCLPAFGLLVGWFFDAILRAGREAFGRGMSAATWCNAAVAGLVALAAVGFDLLFARPGSSLQGWRLEQMERWDLVGLDLSALTLWPLAAWSAALCVGFCAAARRRSAAGVFVCCALFMGGASLYVNAWLLPAINPIKSGRSFTTELAKHRRADEPVAIYNMFRADYMVYGDYFLPKLDKVRRGEGGPLRDFVGRPERVLVLMREKDFHKLDERYPELPLRSLFEMKIGSRELVLCDNGRE